VLFFRGKSLALLSAIRTATLDNPSIKNGKVFNRKPHRPQCSKFMLVVAMSRNVNRKTNPITTNDYDLIALDKGGHVEVELLLEVLALLEGSEGVEAVAHRIARKKDLFMGHAVFLVVLDEARKSLNEIKVHLQRQRVVTVLLVDGVKEERDRAVQNSKFIAVTDVVISVFSALPKCLAEGLFFVSRNENSVEKTVTTRAIPVLAVNRVGEFQH